MASTLQEMIEPATISMTDTTNELWKIASREFLAGQEPAREERPEATTE